MKKLISYLAALAMTASLIPSMLVHAETAPIAPTADGYYSLEAEDGTYTSDYSLMQNDGAFGGKLLGAFNPGSDEGLKVSWTISGTAGSYDVWALMLGSGGGGTEMDKMGVALNDGDLTGSRLVGNDGTATDTKWRYKNHFGWGYYGLMGWNKLDTIQLTNDNATINFGRIEKGANNLAGIDKIYLVPRSWRWSPALAASVDAAPSDYLTTDVPKNEWLVKADSTGSLILEAEKGDYENAHVVATDKAFGGAYVGEFITDVADSKGSIQWEAEIPDNRPYDVWALTLCNVGDGATGGELSTMQFAAGEDEGIAVSKSGASYKRYSAGDLDSQLSGHYLCWRKVCGKKVFGAGKQDFLFALQSQGLSGRTNWFALDRIVITPSENFWSPSETDYVSAGSTAYLTEDTPCAKDAPFVPDKNQVIWMEAEKADFDKFSVASSGSASGGELIGVGVQDTSDDEYLVDFTFDVKEAQSYDVWVLAPNYPDGSHYHFSKYETSLDGETYKSYDDGQVYNGYDVLDYPILYSQYNQVGANLDIRWTKVNAGEMLTAGRHNFAVKFNRRRLPRDNYIIGFLDCVAVVPSNMNWVPDSVNKPVDRENGYAWIEAENSDTEKRFGTWFGESASGRGYLWEDNTSLRGNEKLNYNFKLANDGNYDIYFLGSQVDVSYLSQLYYDFDSNAETLVDENDSRHVNVTWKSNTYMWTNGNSTYNAYWQKIGENVSLTAGEHVLNTEWKTRSAIEGDNDDPAHYMLADAYVIVPTGWEFEMPDTESVLPAMTALNLDATEKVETLKARYANGVTSDLEGLELAGSAGSTISYTAKTNYIAADGKVTRPAAGEANAYGRLSVFAKKLPSVSAEGGFMYALDSDSSQTLRLLVLATPAVSYQNFAATYADGTEIVPNALTSGATVNASVAVKKADTKDRTALLAAAVYQNGVLVKVESASAVLSEEYQPITTSVILPESEDMSGITIRVFLWDSLDCANPYADPIEY